MEPVGIGIIGYGRIGREHARWISACREARVVAVADATPARRSLASADGYAPVESIDSLLPRDDVHAVLIATPTSMHFDAAMTALRAGRHVMVEKPVTLDLPQAHALQSEAAKRKRVLSVFHNRRWDVDYLTVLAAVRAGQFGKVINVESRLGQWAPCVGPAAKEYRPEWRNEAAFGGGGLYDWGSHFVDQVWRLLLPAKPVSVFAQLRGNVWTSDCDDFARVCINFDSGAVAMVEINTTTTQPLPRWHIDGTLGSATGPCSPTFDTREWARIEFSSADRRTWELTLPAEGLSESQIWQQFAGACRGESEPAVTIASVLPTMALLDAARRSSSEGVAVKLDPAIVWID